jgi:polyphosphate kinase 2 (PPK2 family)
MYIQRYIQYFPAAGEIVIFDRSWYNRAGVEYVMVSAPRNSIGSFLKLCPITEKYMVDGGIILNQGRQRHMRNAVQILDGSQEEGATAPV